MATGLYEFAEPDWIVYPARDGETRPDDPLLRSQWQLDKIKAPQAWNAYTGDGSITCAFVDTGVDLTHPDLAPLLVPGFNVPSNLSQAAGGLVGDVNGHGTSVAGAALAMGNNFSGGSGVCWTGRIMPIRATNYTNGSAFMSNILLGANWAVFSGAKIISVSYAGVENSSVEPTAVAIRNLGGLLVWAAGNSSTNFSQFDPEATTIVGATDAMDTLAPDSNFGRAIDIMAPGVMVSVPALGGGYVYRSGTSFAAPIAAGVLALAWSAAPGMSPSQAMDVLYQSCDALEPLSPGNNTGWGRVNAESALARATGRPVPRDPAYLPAAPIPESLLPGLMARYYAAPGATTLPTLGGSPFGQATIAPVNVGQGGSPGFPGCSWASSYAVGVQGYILIPTTGVYTFSLNSKDGSRLFIDGVRVLDNDGVHPLRARSGSVRLERGLHILDCNYFTTTAQPGLTLSVRGMGLGDMVVPASMLYHSLTPRVPISH